PADTSIPESRVPSPESRVPSLESRVKEGLAEVKEIKEQIAQTKKNVEKPLVYELARERGLHHESKVEIPAIVDANKERLQEVRSNQPIKPRAEVLATLKENEDDISLLSFMQKIKEEEMSKLPVFKQQENAFMPMHQEKEGELLQRVLATLFQESMNFEKEKEGSNSSNSKRELATGDKTLTDEQKLSVSSHQQVHQSIAKRIIFSKNLESKTLSDNMLTKEIKQKNELIPTLEKDILKKPLPNGDNYINLNRNIEPQSPNVEIKPSLPKESIPKEVLYELIEEAYLHLKKDSSEIHVRLKPEYLGKLELRVIQQNEKITAKFIVENFGLKELIESELDSLKEALLEKGLDLESIEVYVGNEPEKNLERKHQMYADNVKILSYHEENENNVEEGGDKYKRWQNIDPNGNKLFWFISKIDLIA
ncbi:MAG: flagellar hook-length control protein FliK, partial [bacterium]